jgi:hypothetical protein
MSQSGPDAWISEI